MVALRGKVPSWCGVMVALVVGACGGEREPAGDGGAVALEAVVPDPGALALASDAAPTTRAERRGDSTRSLSTGEDRGETPEVDGEPLPAAPDLEEPDPAPAPPRAHEPVLDASAGADGPDPLLPDPPLPHPESEGAPSQVPAPVQPVPAPLRVEGPVIPAGTRLVLALESGLSTRHARADDRFTGRVVEDVLAVDGMVLVPMGAVVEGVVTRLERGDGDDDRAPALEVEARALIADGEVYDLRAPVIEADLRSVGRGGGAETAVMVAAGAAAGAVLGKILGGDGKSATTGAVAGAAAGAAVGMATAGPKDLVLDPGTRMVVMLEEPLTLR